MLAVTAQWMNFGNGGQRASSVAPIFNQHAARHGQVHILPASRLPRLKHELESGERSWFSKEEEAGIQAANRAFCRVTPAGELIGTCFRFAEPGEEGSHLLSAAKIYATLKRKNPAALKDCSCTAFSRLLAQVGRRVHTKYGNGYWVTCSQH